MSQPRTDRLANGICCQWGWVSSLVLASPQQPRSNRKAFIMEELGDVLQALAGYDRAISLSPNNPQCYFDRGNLRFKLGDTNLALQDYARALRLNPNFREVYVARAFVRAELGDEVGAS